MKTYRPVSYAITSEVMARIQKQGIPLDDAESMIGKEFPNAKHFYEALQKLKNLKPEDREFILMSAEMDQMENEKKHNESLHHKMSHIYDKFRYPNN